MIGQTISHYRITAKLGEGGMGEVYLAIDTNLDRKVAIKFLAADRAADPDAQQRFIHEAKAQAMLSHPNIATFHDVSEFKGRAFIVMEYVEGQSLPELARDEKLSLVEILDLVIQIAEGLQAAHEHGVVHRDIKPENVLVTAKRLVKITDFGLAKWKGATTLTKDGTRMGTAYYMSPEQAEGKRVDHRSDIFSLGVILYELICHQRPFDGETEAAIVYAVVAETPEPLARYKAGVPEQLQSVVSKCLTKNPDERYQSAADLVADLSTLRRTLTDAVRVTTPKAVIPQRSRRLAFAVVAGIAVLAVAAALLTRQFLSRKSIDEAGRKMLAVLPFENLGSPDQEYFADGITDEITGKLAAIHDLGVISRTSTMQYKKTTKNLRDIARELGVGYVLEGTILWDKSRDTSRVRILPQLIRVSDDTHLWAEAYERPLTDIFALQADIAARIAAAMNITLVGPEQAAVEAMPTRNLEAYQAYLQGVEYGHEADFGTYQSTTAALQKFQQAVALDSTFALAYARLSRAHSLMYNFRYDRTPARLALARAAADRALTLQPNLPWGHVALCYYYYWGFRDYEKALAQLALAEPGLPNNPEILNTRALIWRRQGKIRDAVEQMKRAFELNPRDASLAVDIGNTCTRLRDYATAERFFDQCITLAPNEAAGYSSKALNYIAWRGDTSLARITLESVPNQDDEIMHRTLFMFHAVRRDYAAALDQLEQIPGKARQSWYSSKNLLAGTIYKAMNEPGRARECFDSARIFLEKAVKKQPDDARLHSELGNALAGLGQSAAAVREGRLGVELMPISKDAILGPDAVADLATIYIDIGDYDAALDKIEYLLSIPSNLTASIIRLGPQFDPLRKLPRFQKLLQQQDKVF